MGRTAAAPQRGKNKSFTGAKSRMTKIKKKKKGNKTMRRISNSSFNVALLQNGQYSTPVKKNIRKEEGPNSRRRNALANSKKNSTVISIRNKRRSTTKSNSEGPTLAQNRPQPASRSSQGNAETDKRNLVPETQSSSASVAGPSRQQQARGKSSPARASGSSGQRNGRLPTGNKQFKSVQNLPDLFRTNFLLGGYGMGGGGGLKLAGVGEGNNPLLSDIDLREEPEENDVTIVLDDTIVVPNSQVTQDEDGKLLITVNKKDEDMKNKTIMIDYSDAETDKSQDDDKKVVEDLPQDVGQELFDLVSDKKDVNAIPPSQSPPQASTSNDNPSSAPSGSTDPPPASGNAVPPQVSGNTVPQAPQDETIVIDDSCVDEITVIDLDADDDDDIVICHDDGEQQGEESIQEIAARYATTNAPLDFIPLSSEPAKPSTTRRRKRNTKNSGQDVLIDNSNKRRPPFQGPGITEGPPIFSSQSSKPEGGATMFTTDKPKQKGLRPIIIDGSNVAFAHGLSGKFSVRGIQLVVDYFKARKHTSIVAFLPQYRLGADKDDREALTKMEKEGNVVFTPSRRVGMKTISSYDDRMMLDYATDRGGIVISKDNFRDIYQEGTKHRDTIANRVLMPTFVGDTLMFPEDPLGRSGPRLDDFLKF